MKMKAPEFANEAEEAKWWAEHTAEITEAFRTAANRGELGSGSAVRQAREAEQKKLAG